MESAVEPVTDEGEIPGNLFPQNGNWSTQTPNSSTLLFIAVEYVKEGITSNTDYKFESETSFSPQPSNFSEFEQHVSPLDPNMSSTARYSPVYSDSVENGYGSVVVLPNNVNPLITPDMGQNSNTTFINTTSNQNSYHLASPTSPMEPMESPLSADNNLLRQVVTNRFLQMVTPGNGIEVEESTDTANSTEQINIDYNQRSPDENQIIDKELQLVQFPVDAYQQDLSLVDRNLKVDPDQVELLITDQNTGISYSGYVSQDFLIGRTPLPALPEDEQQLNNVLKSLESHGLVMEAQDETHINGVDSQNQALAMTDGQMMLQDPLLDSDLLLQAPVEIALDDNVIPNTNALVLKPDMPNNEQILSPNLSPNTTANDALAAMGIEIENNTNINETNPFESTSVKQECLEFNDENLKMELEAQQLRRSRRQSTRQGTDDDVQLLNRVQSISDKPVPSRARATLPASYLVINKLPSASPNDEPEYGVFARKAIQKRTQFGPLEGVLLDAIVSQNPSEKCNNSKEFQLLLESETGAMHKLDISDENSSNWMRFVRPAKSYSEQNLVLSQQGYSLYYTTTKNILPRQELQVGYSAIYAAKRKLQILQPSPDEESSWPCFECPLKFSTSDELQKHLNVHDDNKEDTTKPRVKKNIRFKRRAMECPSCARTFLRRHSFSRHMLQHISPAIQRDRQIRKIKRTNVISDCIDKDLEWKCDICCLHFPNPSLLNLHELAHKTDSETITGLPSDLGSGCNEGEFLIESGAVQCPQCGNEYANRKMLIDHVAEHGNKYSQNNKLPEESKKAYKCYMCYKAFASRERLLRHMLVHGSDESKPLKCDTCPKRFLNNSALSCHLKTHKLDKKIFECPICKTTFDQILLLKEHVKSHCVDGQYTCPHCNKVFKEYSIIRKHIRAFHCDRKHGCQYCGKPFPTLDKLRMHLLKHSDHREFLCSECGKQFKRKDKLKEHMKRMHSGDREPRFAPPRTPKPNNGVKKFMPKVQPTDYHRFIYKCHSCLLGFKRRGMLVNHLAKRHPDISPDSVPELNLPILKTTRDYYCQYCDKVYKSSSKRKAHILKNHPGAELPMSNRHKGGIPDIPGVPNPTFSQTVGSVTTNPHGCQWCHKQYASKAKLLQHQRKKHQELLPSNQKQPRIGKILHSQDPQSPGIPEEGRFMNSPDIPDPIIDTSGLTDDALIAEVTQEQLNELSASNYMGEDGKVIIASANLRQSYKQLAEEAVLSQAIENFDDQRMNNNQFYRLVQLPSGQLTLGPSSCDESAVSDGSEPSRLYRLLTGSTPFPPYPPR